MSLGKLRKDYHTRSLAKVSVPVSEWGLCISCRQTPRQAITMDGLYRQGDNPVAADAGAAQLLGGGICRRQAHRQDELDTITYLITIAKTNVTMTIPSAGVDYTP